MDTRLLHQFDKELSVEYRGETYRARDNGSVYRQRRPNQRKRPLDGIWTFGWFNASTGYMQIGTEVVHRIIATAFYGTQPSEKHIVDHIDTNRSNNRVENLRWVTRLDNLLQNPITLRRIKLAYGSIEQFLKDPGTPIKPQATKNFEWMRTVSKEEAQKSYENFIRWAEADKEPKGGVLSEWVYGRRDEPVVEEILDVQSPTPNAIQRKWRTPSEFLMCPDNISLTEYAARLKFGTVFARNPFGQSLVVTADGGDGRLIVVCNLTGNYKQWSVAKVTIENEKFVHESGGTYFTLQGALKQHCSLLGVPFGESIDDYS
jgi:hypothetical protein